MTCVTPIRAPEAADNRVPLGHHSTGTLSLDLDRLLAGRLLIQGSSGAGKSRTLRRIIEEAFDYTTLAIVDPEGEFENLARHIGATTIRAVELTADGLTAAATRSRRASASSAEPATCGASRWPSSMHTSMVCAQSSRGAPTRPAKNAAALMIRWSGSRSVRSMSVSYTHLTLPTTPYV